jgi:tetratricopeptide (TPR) repeat protein
MASVNDIFLVATASRRESSVIEDTLKAMNFSEITLVDNGLAALRLIQRRPNYFLLADWNLPQLSGLKLLAEIRRDESSAATPVLLLISNQGEGDLEKAESLKVNGFLKTPVSPNDLQDKINEALGLKEEPEKLELIINKADELLDSGDVEAALAEFDQVIDKGTTRVAELHTDVGTVLHKQGRHEEAIKSFEEAVAFDPDLARPYAGLGNSYLAAGRLEEARSSLKKALELSPDDPDTQVVLADTFLRLGENSEAERVFTKVLGARPNDVYVFNRLGIAFRMQKKYKQAAANYLQALKISDRDENLYFNLGRCYFEMGQTNEARECMNRALKINPAFSEAQELLDIM